MRFIEYIGHLISPKESNNQKAKIIHPSSLLIFAFFLLIFQYALSFTPKTGLRILGYASNISIDEIIRLTNERRAKSGLSPLEYNSTLASAAGEKGEDMINRGYWAHVAPDGTEPWKFFTGVGYAYRYAGENLARDFSDAPSAVNAWMASPSHRDNILSPKYKDIGIAVVEGSLNGVDTTIIVELFGTKISEAPQVVPIAKATTNVAARVVGEDGKATLNTTPLPTFEPTDKEAYLGQTQGESQEVPETVLVSPFISTKSISLIIVGILIAGFSIDSILVSKRKISRISGRGFAHISFLGMILAVILILRSGQVL